MKNAGKACNNRLYRHIRTFEKIIKNYFVIYVLNHGRIVEQGTHEELLSQQGEYCQMYQDYVRKEM